MACPARPDIPSGRGIILRIKNIANIFVLEDRVRLPMFPKKYSEFPSVRRGNLFDEIREFGLRCFLVHARGQPNL
jgi:hypothetical protein